MHAIKNYEFYYKLRTLPYVEEIALFGSRAKGSQLERSDIDLAIRCPNATHEDWLHICAIIDSSDTLLHIDCVRLDNLNDERLAKEIQATKMVLFKRVSNNFSWYEIFLDLGEALEKLEQALTLDSRQFLRTEAIIQVFEYTFELYWKWLRKLCIEAGFVVDSPRATLQQAYAMRLIDQETTWLGMMKDRNLTSHTYKYPLASEIAQHCKEYCPLMRTTYERLKKQFQL